jgi:hypothetical protein
VLLLPEEALCQHQPEEEQAQLFTLHHIHQ